MLRKVLGMAHYQLIYSKAGLIEPPGCKICARELRENGEAAIGHERTFVVHASSGLLAIGSTPIYA